jgi:hypothetical protein
MKKDSLYKLGMFLMPISVISVSIGCGLLIGVWWQAGIIGFGIGLFIDGVSLLKMYRYLNANKKDKL